MTTRGIMAENMFLGKSQLLNWLNSTLSLHLEHIEDTCSGAVACQIMDILHPGSVKMQKVDFNVRSDYEFERNYKELQQAFNKIGIDRAFNVKALSKGKRQDNNEFMQWFKGYWDHVTGGQDFAAEYDAVARRQLCKTGDWKKFSLGEGAARPIKPPPTTKAKTDSTIPAIRSRTANTSAQPHLAESRPMSTTKAALKTSLRSTTTTSHHPPAPQDTSVAQLKVTIADLTEQLTEMKLQVDTANRERDFYFDKLRDIEILCQAPELANIPILKTVEKVLYAADANEAKEVMIEAQEQYGAQLLYTNDGEVAALPEDVVTGAAGIAVDTVGVDDGMVGEESVGMVAEDVRPAAEVVVLE